MRVLRLLLTVSCIAISCLPAAVGQYRALISRVTSSQLPRLLLYWVLHQAVENLTALEPAAGLTVQTGVLHPPLTQTHKSYSLYLPEIYDPSRA